MRLLGLALGLLFSTWGFVAVVSSPSVFGVIWMLGSFAVVGINTYQLFIGRDRNARH